jgi:CheY-like chemotaxis protein
MDPSERSTGPGIQARPLPGARLVLLDDDEDFVGVVRDLLESEGGHRVDVHRSWHDAVEFVKECQPDLVIVDMLFGGEQQGVVILLELKEDPATQHVPLIVCSGDRVSLSSYRELLAQYEVAVIEKPFEVDDFLAMVRRALAGGDHGPVTA